MAALLISLGVLIAAAGVIGRLAGNTTRSTMLVTVVVGALVALSSLFFIL